MTNEQATILALHACVQAIIGASSNEAAAQIALALTAQIEAASAKDTFLIAALNDYRNIAEKTASGASSRPS
ncbi:MAG: hypothetical protein JHC38_01940 [Thiotrichales bacterium]|jgi:hypothetical protein|nr:hypothetical protein [Thiotrichales bacterium]